MNARFLNHFCAWTILIVPFALLAAGPRITFQKVGSYKTTNDVRAVKVLGNRAYVCADVFLILDVSDPSKPVRLGSYRPQAGAFWPRDVQVLGNFAYVADEERGLHEVDVSDPSQPRLARLYPEQQLGDPPRVGASVVHLAGGHAFVAWRDLVFREKWQLEVLDISRPGDMVRVGFYEDPGFILDVEVDVAGRYAYALDFDLGSRGALLVLDVSSPNKPVLVGSYRDIVVPRRLRVDGDYVFVTSELGLEVIDVSTPAKPTRVGFYQVPGGGSSLDLEGGLAFFRGYFQAPLYAVDLREPTRPELRGFARIGARSFGNLGLDVAGNLVYVAELSDPPWDFDVSLDIYRFTYQHTIAWDLPAYTRTNRSPLMLTATASSGLPVSYELLSGPAILSGNTLTLTGLGPVKVRAMQPGNELYVPAVVERTMTVLDVAALFLGISTKPSQQVEIALDGPPGASFLLEAAERLGPAAQWRTLLHTNPATGLFLFVDTDAQSGQRFYRMRQP